MKTTEIEVWIGKDAYNMRKISVKTQKDIDLIMRALNEKGKELDLQNCKTCETLK